MRAAIVRELGGPEQVRVVDVPEPEASSGEVLIDVRAAGVNFADVLMVAGQYQSKPPLPFVPGAECAGVVRAIGDGVDGVRVGDRVLAAVPHGAFAERVVAPASAVRKIPDSLGFPAAGGFAIAYGTAHVALWHRAKLQPGETVLVTGAAGGVGVASIEVAKALGARVIAVVSSTAKVATCRDAGADEVIDLSATDLRAGVKALTGGAGVDVVVENVGGALFEPCVRSLKWEGRLLVIGFASGTIPQVPANLTLLKNASVVGVFWGAYFLMQPAILHESFDRLFALIESGKLVPPAPTEVPLEKTAEALATLKDRRALGKLVVVP